ncbi:MAG: chalcone isomerase family protein [Burkholderiales bacterium]
MASRQSLLLALVALAASLPALAAEVAGVKFPEQVQAEGKQLVLNGAGLRRKFIFKVYAMALYLPARAASAAAAIDTPGPKRISIGMLRDVDAKTFSDALREGIEANQSEAEVKAIEPRIKQLEAVMQKVGTAKDGMRIRLDWVPGAGTQVSIDGAPADEPISGEDFYRALLRIWLGPHAVQNDLKRALLGAQD